MASVIGTNARPWFKAKVQGVVAVEAGEDGLQAGTIQKALQALATRIQAIEDGA
jgi:hypothetical protein